MKTLPTCGKPCRMNLPKIKNIAKCKKAKTLIVALIFACLMLVPYLHASASIIDFFKDPVGITIGYLMLGIQTFCLMLLSIAGTVFAAVIDPQNISGPSSGILNKQAIKEIWIMVRDVFNMVFILVLLFAAFCTIFQIEKWSLKKVWLNVLIHALLVNFSFTIARFIIDISNVAMYYFVNSMFVSSTGASSGSSIMANFSATAKLEGILSPKDFVSQPIAYELMIIIFTFILGMTLLIMAALFVIRLVALAILIMFSPIGFVGYVFPSTHKFADQWWNKLFSYSFFAPIMIFMMAIAINISKAIGDENYNFFVTSASGNTDNPGLASFVASAAFFMIPIIILWFGLGIAKSMSIAGADTVVSGVKNGGKWLASTPWKAAKWGANATGVPGGAKKGWEDFKKKGKLFGAKVPLAGSEAREAREAKISGLMTGGSQGYGEAERDHIRMKANEIRDKWKKAGGASEHELEKALSGSDRAAKLAAAVEAAEKNGFNDTPGGLSAMEKYKEAARAVKDDSVFKNMFDDKVKEKHVRFVVTSELMNKESELKRTLTDAEKFNVYDEHISKMSADKIAGQKGLFEDDDAVNYFKKKNEDDKKFQRHMARVASKMSTNDVTKLRNAGLSV